MGLGMKLSPVRIRRRREPKRLPPDDLREGVADRRTATAPISGRGHLESGERVWAREGSLLMSVVVELGDDALPT